MAALHANFAQHEAETQPSLPAERSPNLQHEKCGKISSNYSDVPAPVQPAVTRGSSSAATAVKDVCDSGRRPAAPTAPVNARGLLEEKQSLQYALVADDSKPPLDDLGDTAAASLLRPPFSCF